MPKVAKEMSALSVGRLQKPGFHFVGGVRGLAMRVTPNRGRYWVLRLTVAGRRRDMGLGGFPTVPLARARELGREAHELIRQGVNPFDRRREARQTLAPVDAIDNKVEAAYRRGDLFEKRMQMMRDWAAFVLPSGYDLIS